MKQGELSVPKERTKEGALGDQGCPNLDAKGVLALSYEGFDLQVLLQRLEEELDLPPVPVDLTYGARREPEVIGEKDDIFSCFRVLGRNPAEGFRIFLLHPRSGKTDDLVGKDMTVFPAGAGLCPRNRRSCPSSG